MSARAVIFQIEWLCFEEKYNVEYNTISRGIPQLVQQ